jgi:hypothetical protein
MPTLPPRLPPLKRSRALGAWLNELRDFCETLMPSFGVGLQSSHTAIGVSHRVSVPPTQSAIGNWFQGEYSLTTAYQVGQGVKISGGIAAGLYICILNITMHPAGSGSPPQADASTYPWLGNNWTFIGQILDQSNWI